MTLVFEGQFTSPIDLPILPCTTFHFDQFNKSESKISYNLLAPSSQFWKPLDHHHHHHNLHFNLTKKININRDLLISNFPNMERKPSWNINHSLFDVREKPDYRLYSSTNVANEVFIINIKRKCSIIKHFFVFYHWFWFQISQ